MEHIALIEKYFKAWNTFDEKIFFEIFDDEIEIYNVHFPAYKGREGVKAYKDNFKSRISHGDFQIITMMDKKINDKDVLLAEWIASVTYRAGAQVGDFIATKPFTFALRGV